MATILVIDDDEMFRRLVGKLIENAGHEAVHAADGEAGLALISAGAPDLVVTDMTMPGISGAELIVRLRADRETAHLPVVAVSAHEAPDELSGLRDAGVSAFLPKTMDPESLIAGIVDQLP